MGLLEELAVEDASRGVLLHCERPGTAVLGEHAFYLSGVEVIRGHVLRLGVDREEPGFDHGGEHDRQRFVVERGLDLFGHVALAERESDPFGGHQPSRPLTGQFYEAEPWQQGPT